MSGERGPILRKRGNQPPRDADAPPEAPVAPSPADRGAAPTGGDGPSARGAGHGQRDERGPRGGSGGSNDGRDDRRARAPEPNVDRRGPPSGGGGGSPMGRDRGPGPSSGPVRREGRVGRDAGPGTRSEAPAPSAPGPRSAEPAGRPAPSGGRRFYDPRAERGGPGAGAPPPAAAKDGKPGGKRMMSAGRPLVSDEKTELKTQAQKLAKEKGVPLVHAYRILKGQTTLNDVLKGMMRKERFEQLVAREGVDRELAGQVASGHLPKQRAVLLTRMRSLRKQKLHIDGIKAAEVEKRKIGIDIFGRGWVLGRVRAARPYDFDFLPDGADKTDKLFKHDVKAVCTAEDFEAARRACDVDVAVKKLGLAQTEDREQRVRPTDDTMLRFIDDQRIVRFTMRDGEQILGRLRSFGRWDAELVLEGGELVTVFFHGLHASSLNLGHSDVPVTPPTARSTAG